MDVPSLLSSTYFGTAQIGPFLTVNFVSALIGPKMCPLQTSDIEGYDAACCRRITLSDVGCTPDISSRRQESRSVVGAFTRLSFVNAASPHVIFALHPTQPLPQVSSCPEPCWEDKLDGHVQVSMR